MNKKAQYLGYAVPVVLIFLAIFLVLFIVLVYPEERAKMLSYDSEGGYYTVQITSSGFYPAELEVSRGERVSWINLDSTKNTVTFLDEKSGTLIKSESYSRTFSEPGSYGYTSDFNPSFKGTIIVK